MIFSRLAYICFIALFTLSLDKNDKSLLSQLLINFLIEKDFNKSDLNMIKTLLSIISILFKQ